MRELQIADEPRVRISPERLEQIKRIALKTIAESEKPRISWDFYAETTNWKNKIPLSIWNTAVDALECEGLVEVVWSGGEPRCGLCQFQATAKGREVANGLS